MKKLIIVLFLSLTVFSCEEQLNKTAPFISENVVFESESLTESYIANIYENLEFQYGTDQSLATYSSMGAENITFADWQTPNVAFIRLYSQVTGPGQLDRWNYGNIRNMNFLLENIGKSENLDEDYIKSKTAEVRFLRAWEYFSMVKRWGGVPLITKVQSLDDSPEELFVPRSTEKEVYDFIYNEIQAIVNDLSSTRSGVNGRADKYAALMLQSRAMLYAASIARNGELSGNQLTGIPASEADAYFQKSYDASMAIVNSGVFSLMNQGNNKETNYRSIFLVEGTANPEVIFAEVFEPIIKGHVLDTQGQPAGFNATWNSNFPVIYDFVELFDFTDGRSGKISRSLLNNQNDWDIHDFFGNRDPRLRASIFYPESEFQGKKVWFHESTILEDNRTVNRVNNLIQRGDGTQMPEASEPRNRRNSGLLMRKRIDDNNTTPLPNNSGQDYVVFRYGETLLNLAEAAFYLGKQAETLDALNQIRDRAGMPRFTSASEEIIRKERQVELCFEDHRFWDLIRWRQADKVLNNVRNQGLVFKYKKATNRYVITLKNAETVTRSFSPERYYLPFDQNRLADNPSLVQNPGY